jgi:hypothetical protein
LLDLLQLGRELLSPRLQLREVDSLGLIGIEQSLILTPDSLAALEQCVPLVGRRTFEK